MTTLRNMFCTKILCGESPLPARSAQRRALKTMVCTEEDGSKSLKDVKTHPVMCFIGMEAEELRCPKNLEIVGHSVNMWTNFPDISIEHIWIELTTTRDMRGAI